MAGEYNPDSNEPLTSDRASKVLIRLRLMEDCIIDPAVSDKAMRNAARNLGELTTGQVMTTRHDNGSVYLGVSAADNIGDALPVVVRTADATIREHMLPFELEGARMSPATYNVSADSVWRNLGLDPATDVTQQAREIIDVVHDRMWEVERYEAWNTAEVEGL